MRWVFLTLWELLSDICLGPFAYPATIWIKLLGKGLTSVPLTQVVSAGLAQLPRAGGPASMSGCCLPSPWQKGRGKAYSQFGLLAPYAISKQETAKQALKRKRIVHYWLLSLLLILFIRRYLLHLKTLSENLHTFFCSTVLRSVIGSILLMRKIKLKITKIKQQGPTV